MARWHALWLKPDLAPDVEREVNIERVQTMSRQQAVSAAAHTVNAAVLIGVAWPFVPHLYLLGMGVLFLCAAAAQLRVWLRHRGKGRPSAVPDRTLTRIVLWSVGFGMLWGTLTAAVLIGTPERQTDLIVCLVIVGMASGGAMMLFSIPSALIAFLVLSVLPPWLVVMVRAPGVHWSFYAYTSAYAGFLLVSARYSYETFVENVRLRLLTAELAFKAEDANRAKSRFLANMSHELRTPLNAIIGFAEVIHHQFKGPVGNPQYIEFARSIHESGLHLVGIINDILDLSKVEEGKSDLTEEPVAIADVIERVGALMRQAIDTAGLTLTISLAPALPRVMADARKLDQVFINILSNAVKFTPRNGRIAISAKTAAVGLVIAVTDTGVGIPQDELGDVLKPFVQGRYAERRRIQGTGLGLPLADQMIRLHGGRMELASEAGVGTAITIVLPAARFVPPQSLKSAG